MTFGERDNVIVFEAKAALAIAEPFADNVASGVLAPPLGVAAGHGVGLSPAVFLGQRVEEPLPLLSLLPRQVWWR